jgi:histidinol phosphatase-like PHP family hydrolase
MKLGNRIDLHIHSLFSDGVLLPSEIVRRAEALGYSVVAITDHADASNLEFIIPRLVTAANELKKHSSVQLIPGVELTHIPPQSINELARHARQLGAKLILVHGETLVEPVQRGTNHAAVICEEVDILAHPGLLSEVDAALAAKNNIYIELSARKGHCLTNGHVAKIAKKTEAKMVLNTDLHEPTEFISQEQAFQIALGSGLNELEALKVIKENPENLAKHLAR